jgi:hypothetical protein
MADLDWERRRDRFASHSNFFREISGFRPLLLLLFYFYFLGEYSTKFFIRIFSFLFDVILI